jgi:DNA-binding FadR family transcriptional regulator
MGMPNDRKRKLALDLRPSSARRPPSESAMARHFATSRKPRKAAETLAQEIMDFILENGLVAGTRLAPERQLLADTGRSRGTLREALRILESRGLIEVRPGATGGAFVRRPLPADLGAAIGAILMFEGASMADVLAAREDMEAAALARAAQRITPEHLDEMEDSVERLLEHLADRDRFVVEAGRFHAIINGVADSPVLRILNEALRTTQLVSTNEFSLDYRRRVASEHRAIIDALRVADTPLACKLMRAHVSTSAHPWRPRLHPGEPHKRTPPT